MPSGKGLPYKIFMWTTNALQCNERAANEAISKIPKLYRNIRGLTMAVLISGFYYPSNA